MYYVMSGLDFAGQGSVVMYLENLKFVAKTQFSSHQLFFY